MNISEFFWKNFEKQTKNELRRRIFSGTSVFGNLMQIGSQDSEMSLGFPKKIPVADCNGDEDFVF